MGAARGVEWTNPGGDPSQTLFICMTLFSTSVPVYDCCCSTGPKLCDILDSANHSGWPYGILNLIAWDWAYHSDSTPIKPVNYPISATQTG